MPESRGSGQYEPPHATPNYQRIGSEVKMAHSGAWVGCGDAGDSEAQVTGPAHGEASWIHTSEIRKQGQFVTVVEVEKDGEETADTTCHAWRATSQPVPRPAPRGFVTVVAVGTNTDTNLHLDHTGNIALDSNVKLHMELPTTAVADYVNQETIDRERKAAEEMDRETPTPSSVPDQVVVYRLPGERLGLGLKFDGGVGAQECVRRLFIQSVAPDSPAARAAVPWGELNPGDQILNIEGCAVSSMTRVQCVSFLKDAAMKITIGVLKGNGQLPDLDTCTAKSQEYFKEEQEDYSNGSAHPPPLIVGEMRKRMPPPPLPPRARPRKSPARPPKDPLPPPPSAFQDYEDETPSQKFAGKTRSEDKDHPEWRELLSRRGRSGDLEELLEDLEFHLPSSWAAKRLEESGLPPRPTFYLDLLGEEDAAGQCESESDETSSSVSTVIDRLSLSSSTTVSRNSSFNATADASRFDLARALSPFEQLEKELETEVNPETQPSTPAAAPRDEVASAPPIDRSTKPATVESAEQSTVETDPTASTEKMPAPKTKTRSSIKSFALSLKGRPFSRQQGKNASERTDRAGGSRGDGFLSMKRPGKRPAPPPPPPPRSVEAEINHTNSLPCTTSATTTTTTTTASDVKETNASSDSNGNVSGNYESYIHLVAEAAQEVNMNKSPSLRRNKLERQTAIDLPTEEEPSDLSFVIQSEQSEIEPEYLLSLDSPGSEKETVVVHDVKCSVEDDKQEKEDGCDSKQECKDLSQTLELSTVGADTQTGMDEGRAVSQASHDHDVTSPISKRVNISAHEEDHVLTISSNYIETCAEMHPSQETLSPLMNTEEDCMQSLATVRVTHQETNVQRDQKTVAGDDMEVNREQDTHGGVESEGKEGEVKYDNAERENTVTVENNSHLKESGGLCDIMDINAESCDTVSDTDVTVKHASVNENEIHGNKINPILVSEDDECDEYVRLSKVKPDNALVSETETTKVEIESNNGDVNMKTIEEENTITDASTTEGAEIECSMIEYSTLSESSMKAQVGTDNESEEHLESVTEGGNLERAEEDQNIYEEIDETPCTDDQEQALYYSCSSRKHSIELSPRDLSEDTMANEDPELYDDVEGAPDQSGSESQESSDLQGLKLSGPEEDSGEQDTIDEESESLYDDVIEDHSDNLDENIDKSAENVYENLEENEVAKDKEDESVVSGEESEDPDTARDNGVSSSVRTVTECVRHRRLRQDIGDLIRREMNLDDNVTVEVEEEEEVESTVECENEEELLLVMRALRRDQPGDSLRWLEDDSDDDDNAGAADGDKESKEEGEGEREERGQDPPGSADDPQPTQPPPRGQSAQEDTGLVVARALSHPQGRKECPRAPPPSPPPLLAAAQSPVFPATTAAALHSLARGTSRHPHQTAPHHRSPPLALPRLTNPCTANVNAPVGDGFCVRAADKARTNVLARIEETEVDDSTSEDENPVVVETVEAIKSAKFKYSTLSKVGASSVDGVQDLVGVTRAGTQHTSTVAAMVARTDTNQGGKVASCPDDVQSLSLLPLQGKQEVDTSLLPTVSAVVAAPLHVAPEDLDGATSAPSSGDAASDGPSTPSTFCSDGEEQEELDKEERSSENTPEPPDFSTHPDLTEQEAESQAGLKEVPAEGSVRAEPIVAVSQDPGNQSLDEKDAVSHAEASFESGGGGNVSVATCEHRFSSSGGAPPPYSRLPPDGHEFPSNYAEGLPDKMSRYARYSRLAMELDSPGSPPPSTTATPRTRSAPGTPLGPPPPIPRSSPTTNKTYSNDKTVDSGNNKWTGNEERKSREQTPTRSRWRRQDERSEKSVRDKIAMFSTDGPDQPHPKTRKLDKQEGEEGTMKRSFTEDDVRLDNSVNSNSKSGREAQGSSRSLSKTSVFSSMINVSTSEPKDNTKHMSTASSEVDIRQDTPPTPRSHGLREEKRADDDSSTTGLHSRSQSLIDIGRSSLTKRHSVGAYDRPSVYQYGIEKPEERERRTSLTNLIEQRRKSFGSKLLGLVIPESRGGEGNDKASIDLPRISSVPPTTASKTMSLPREGQRSPRLYKADSISSIDSCESNTSSRHSSLNAPPWKSHGTSTLPKYSPAFKRKNVTVFSKSDNLPPLSGRSHSACSTSPTSDLSQPSPIPPCHSPSKSLETISPPSSEHTYDMSDGRYNIDRHSYSKLSLSQKSSFDSRLNRAEDSDNDSAVSSTQSSYSQGMSPPSSPMPDQDELDDRRGSRGYRSRLSQQNSLDEQEAARRVLKRGSIEAENRRNVINSARCSSGKNSDEHQTPEIIRKYSSASDRVEDSDRFPHRLDSELREGPKVTGLRRQTSTSSTSSTASSRRSSHDSSRRNSKDSVIHVTKYDEAKVSAEPVYFDQEGEMYKESQLKVAYVNEITDDYDQINECNNKDVIAEVPLSSPPSRRTAEASDSSDTSQGVSPHPRRGKRWAELEMKYGSTNSNSDIESKIHRMRKSSDSSSPDRTKKKSGGFRALAEKWQQRAEEDTAAPPQPNLARRESNGRLEASTRSSRQYEERSTTTSTLEKPTRPSRLYDDQTDMNGGHPSPSSLHSESSQSSSNSLSSNSDNRPENLDIPRAEVPDRKLSMPEYGNGGVKMRDRREGNTGGAPSRPTSLIEGGDGGVMDSNYLSGCAQLSPTASTDSRDDLFTPEALSRTSSKEVLDAFSRPRANIGISFPRVGATNTPKIDDIMRAFERHDMRKRGGIGGASSHPRMSSLDSTNSDEGLIGAQYGSVTSLASGQRDQYGSITSLASSTSLISPQELAQLIEEANQSLEESGTPSHEILVVVLHREIVGHGSIGITLAGGADYETKEITVHKVIPSSLADRDGRIQRGDRVLSINGRNLRGVSHKEALSILKSPRPEVVLVLSRSRSVTPQESNMTESDGNFIHRPSLINHITSPRPPKILESPMDSKSLISDVAAMSVPRGPPFTITLVKDGAGLGFSLEGGKDSPLGDRPLTVKKIFSGGAADKGGILKVGDELVSVNTVDVTGMARIEAWNFLKKLPDGTVSLVLRQKLENSSRKNEE